MTLQHNLKQTQSMSVNTETVSLNSWGYVRSSPRCHWYMSSSASVHATLRRPLHAKLTHTCELTNQFKTRQIACINLLVYCKSFLVSDEETFGSKAQRPVPLTQNLQAAMGLAFEGLIN